ncbi:MAG TPA: hypothetical protein DDW42_05245 [Desulfobacteraceae bacterium]|nr:hypothetical protein [Desulfobacteraceae bacterium]
MATKPQKRTGFSQGIYSQSSTRKEEIGTLRVLRDGRKFRYARAGAGALGAGKVNVAAASVAEVIDENCASNHAIGDFIIEETITAGVAYVEDQYAGGFFQVTDATGEGHMYEITSSSAGSAAATTIILTLANPIRVALVKTTTQFSLVQNPQMNVVQTDVEENMATGIAPIAVTIGYYFWNQTGGVATALGSDTSAIGTALVIGATAGAVKAIPTPLDIDMVFSLGVVFGTAMVVGEYTQIFMTLD